MVRKLVDAACPQYSVLPISRLAKTGSSNALFRLGSELLIRLPRQPGGGCAIEKERRWLPHIRQALPASIPEFVFIGEPDFGYSERWAIVRWLHGELPARCDPDAEPPPHSSQLALDLAAFISALRAIEIPDGAAKDAQLRTYRGKSLASHDQQMRKNIDRCRSIHEIGFDFDDAEMMWDETIASPTASVECASKWFHGDLVAENLLQNDGRLSGVLDFGGLGIGDPAIDLHGAWELFDGADRDMFRKGLDVDDDEWKRGRAWAVAIGISVLSYYWDTMPERVQDRLRMVKTALADWARD